jgi:hypothetical protein
MLEPCYQSMIVQLEHGDKAWGFTETSLLVSLEFKPKFVPKLSTMALGNLQELRCFLVGGRAQ